LFIRFITSILKEKTRLKKQHHKYLKKWAKQKGQLFAKDRIVEIYEQFEDILPGLPIKIDEQNDFIDKIVEYRIILRMGIA
jgi:hypothetical protein